MSEKYLGQNLIFIISLPRSGSTLLQRVLAGHSDIGASSEPWIMLHQAYGRRSDGISAEYSADWAALGVNDFIRHYTDGDEVYDDAVRAFAEVIYANAMQKADARYFVDKTPRYVMIIEDLIRWFPSASFVFLIRNPLSVLASIVKTQISHDLTTLERFTPELLTGPRAILKGIELLGDRATVVRYEEFVAEPERELARLCERLNVSYDDSMLEYVNTPEMQGFMKDRTGIQQHTRPTDQRTHAWRKALQDPQQLEFARGYLSELGPEIIEQLGYSFAELSDAVQEASSRTRGAAGLLPWTVAILTPQQKRGRDQMHVFRYRSIRDHGPVKGRLLCVGNFFRSLIRSIRFTVGRAAPVTAKPADKNDSSGFR